ncbi:MAG: LytTR family transcriptional regulator [Pseudomonadota bacterium]|nr:LytTR family transcriptional regulator [Pseudomonadota bacterium]
MLIEDAVKNRQTELSERFMRIHRDALVNITHISGIEKSRDPQFLMVFKGITDRLEFSRRHVAEVKKFLKST